MFRRWINIFPHAYTLFIFYIYFKKTWADHLHQRKALAHTKLNKMVIKGHPVF